MEAGHPVTPSEEVDQAWHLHLLYTRSYWEELCGGVLGRPLHHGPTMGGPAEGQKFDDWYRRTLDSYRRMFGAEPPADIWPPPADRFRHADRFRRINTAEHLVVSKARLRHQLVGPAGLVILMVATGCAAAVSSPARQLLAQSGGGDVGFGLSGIFIVVVAALVLWAASKGGRKGGGGGVGSSGCGGVGCGGCGG